ncbi:MAG TPA: hypothetical protein VFP68_12790, partial [Burkholderiaceae bacterium]|nr:hypothetical protein [Burkholderiaceae bacterium]
MRRAIVEAELPEVDLQALHQRCRWLVDEAACTLQLSLLACFHLLLCKLRELKFSGFAAATNRNIRTHTLNLIFKPQVKSNVFHGLEV